MWTIVTCLVIAILSLIGHALIPYYWYTYIQAKRREFERIERDYRLAIIRIRERQRMKDREDDRNTSPDVGTQPSNDDVG